MLLLPAEPLPPLPGSERLTQAQAIEAWLDDVHRYQVLRARYDALQRWGSKCWGGVKEARVTVKSFEPGRMK